MLAVFSIALGRQHSLWCPPMRAVFFGTPEIAVPSLLALMEVADVSSVVCQPDRPQGRGLSLQAPAVKQAALARGLPVVQPDTVRSEAFADWLRAEQADFALVIAYGRILPSVVLDIPKAGFFNLHASILPKYRGAAPIQWALLAGETETGISLMKMDAGMDTGPVVSIHRMPIPENATSADMFTALGLLAADVVRADMLAAASGVLVPRAQDASMATMAPLLKKTDGLLDWGQPAKVLHNRVRGLFPWPGAYTTARGKTLKIIEAVVHPAPALPKGTPGSVLIADPEALLVQTGEGVLQILRAQPEGKKVQSPAELVAGRLLQAGDHLGA